MIGSQDFPASDLLDGLLCLIINRRHIITAVWGRELGLLSCESAAGWRAGVTVDSC